MKKIHYFIVLSCFIICIAVLSVYLILNPKNDDDSKIHYSDEYIKYDKMFSFELKEDDVLGKYYIIKKLKSDYQNNNLISIPNTIDDIPVKKLIGDNNNFDSFKNIKIIEIPENIIYIGIDESDNGVLYDGTIGASIFTAYNTQLVEFRVDSNNKVYSSSDGILYNKDQSILVRYPASKVGSDAVLNFVVPNTVTCINSKAFAGNEILTSITLDENLLTISSEAFNGCSKLQLINFNENLLSIGDDAFKDCALQKVVIPSSVKKIGSRAFSYNFDLINFTIYSNVDEIGKNVLSGSSKVVVYTESSNVSKLTSLLNDSMKNPPNIEILK